MQKNRYHLQQNGEYTCTDQFLQLSTASLFQASEIITITAAKLPGIHAKFTHACTIGRSQVCMAAEMRI